MLILLFGIVFGADAPERMIWISLMLEQIRNGLTITYVYSSKKWTSELYRSRTKTIYSVHSCTGVTESGGVMQIKISISLLQSFRDGDKEKRVFSCLNSVDSGV